MICSDQVCKLFRNEFDVTRFLFDALNVDTALPQHTQGRNFLSGHLGRMDRHTGHDLPTKVTSDRVGPYRLLNVIGQYVVFVIWTYEIRGGMATVKLGVFALDQDMGSQVAVKIINKDKLVNEREKTSMAREITIMKLLHHPNILRLHDLLESDEKM